MIPSACSQELGLALILLITLAALAFILVDVYINRSNKENEDDPQ